MKKKICLLMIVILSCCLMSSCSQKNEEGDPMPLVVVLTSPYMPSYTFKLDSNNNLNVICSSIEYGDNNAPILTDKSDEVELPDEVVKKIVDLSSRAIKLDPEKHLAFDAISADISYGDIQLIFTEAFAEKNELNDLMAILIEYSPIEVTFYNGIKLRPLK